MPESGASAGSHPPGALPVYLSSFIGRDRELDDLVSLLVDRRVRLLNLVGPGGVGKTRLAVQLAGGVTDGFEDGVVWVDLSGSADASHVPQALADALDLGEAPGGVIQDRLVQVLGTRQVLLVVDNCEHLVAAVGAVVDALLKSCPDLIVITTSRQPLDLAGETAWRVPPLTVPTETAEPATAEADGESDAERMFVARAQSGGHFKPDPATARFVAEICRLVDGLPLALELAAAQTRTLGVAQLAARLREDLGVLRDHRTGTPRRQISVTDALDWSYELLAPQEQAALARLSVFRGPFSIDAAEAVAGDVDPGTLAHTIGGLVDQSVVQTLEEIPGQRHFRLLEPIRLFAANKLSDGGDAELERSRHLEFYATLAAASAGPLQGPEQAVWVQRLRTELDNLRAALTYASGDWNAEHGPQVALRMATDLFWFWNAADGFKEGRDWMEKALALRRGAESPQVLCEAQWAAGAFAWILGDLSAADRRLEEARAGFSALGDRGGVARAQMMLGRVPLYRGDPAAAARLLDESAAAYRELGHSHELAQSLVSLGVAHAMQGQGSVARAATQEALDIFRHLGDPFFIALAVGDLGWVCYLADDLAAAEENFVESLELRRDLGSRWLLAQTLNQLAEVERFAGDSESAMKHLEEALVLAEDVGARAWLAASMRDLGYLAWEAGERQEAATRFMDAIEHYSVIEDPLGLAQSLEALAGLAAAGGSSDAAIVCGAAAEPYRAAAGPPLTPAARSDYARIEPTLETAVANWSEQDWPPIESARAAARNLAVAAPSPSLRARTSTIRIEALGSTAVHKAGTALQPADWTYAKPRHLLFYLLESGPRSRNEIGLVFWPDSSPSQIRRSVRSGLYHLRRALGSRDWILYESGRYRFDRSLDYWYDVEDFEDLLANVDDPAGTDPAAALGNLSRAVDLYRGDFVADLEDDAWALPRRQQLRTRWVEAMLLKARLEEDSDDFATAAGTYGRIIEFEPYNDVAHLGLMTNLARAGDRGGALKHYDEMLNQFADELGAAPSSAVEALARTLRQGGIA